MVESLHNYIKIRSLIFLAMRHQAAMRCATAGEIAQAAETSPDSLYVLAARWNKWGLVKRVSEIQPFGYHITPIGHRYLTTLGNWYRGDVSEIRLSVAEAANMVIWWGDEATRSSSRDMPSYKQLYYIQAPFQTAEDFIKCDMQGRTSTSGLESRGSLLMVHCNDVIEAGREVEKYGITAGQEMLQAFVDAGVARWKKPVEV